MVSAVLSLIALILNVPVAGSIIVRHCSIHVPESDLIIYFPIRPIWTHSHFRISASLGGKCPYFLHCFLHSWHCLHVLQKFCTCILSLSQVKCCCMVASITAPSWYYQLGAVIMLVVACVNIYIWNSFWKSGNANSISLLMASFIFSKAFGQVSSRTNLALFDTIAVSGAKMWLQ